MIFRTLAAAVLLLITASAQAQVAHTRGLDFDQFVAELWKDAQAKGITRGTFNNAFQGVTPDPRVIATTKRQPEYANPARAYVTSIASPLNAKNGLKKEQEWHVNDIFAHSTPRASFLRPVWISCSTQIGKNEAVMNIPDRHLKVRSALARRLVQAQDDRCKERVRAMLCDLNDEQLSSGLGFTPEDIAVLRHANAEPESTQVDRPKKI